MARALAAVALAALLAASAGSGAQAPRSGGSVVLGTLSATQQPTCLRPYGISCLAGTYPIPITEKVLAGAFEPRPDLTYAEDLITRATWTRNPFTVTYSIRPEARWSDGVPVSAQDFVFTWQTVIGLDETSENSVWRRIRRVVPVDAKTVRVVFDKPVGIWRALFDPVLPRHALAGEDPDQVWRNGIDNPKTGEPIASGPFLVRSWDRSKQQLVLARNPRYWGAHKAYLDRIVNRWVTEPVTALQSGEADVIDIFGRPEIVPELRRNGNVRILTVPSTGLEHLVLRVGAGGHPALKSRLVRRALAYAIDRAAIVRDLYAGVAPGLRPVDNALLFANDAYYQPNWSRYRHRPDEAQRLLERAGCRRGGDGIRVCFGERLSLRFVTTAGNPRRQRTLELIQAQLRGIGIEVVPEFATSRAFFFLPNGILGRGAFDVALFATIADAHGVGVGRFLCGEVGNFAGHCDRLLNRELQQILLTLDDERRAEIRNAADRKLADAVPLIPLYQPPSQIAVRKTVVGVIADPLNRLTYRAEDWWFSPGR